MALLRADMPAMVSKVVMARRIRPMLLAMLLAIAAPSSTAHEVAVGRDTVITLERTSCYGSCPVYTVTIDALGNVAYTGVQSVRVEGRQTRRIPISRVAALLETAERIRFRELEDQYRFIKDPDGITSWTVSDRPTTFVTIAHDGQSKRVEDYAGAPEELKQLERQIDEAAGTKPWITLDGETLQQLVRDGWSPTPLERSTLLVKAVGEDEVAVVKGLIDLGIDPNFTDDQRVPPLFSIRSVATARLLLDAGADPNFRTGNGTPLYRSQYLDAEVVEALLKGGARVDEPDNIGRTPLWYAACRGNVSVVGVLLAAGADPKSVAFPGLSALECTRQARESERRNTRPAVLDGGRRPSVQDFDRVILLLEQAANQRGR